MTKKLFFEVAPSSTDIVIPEDLKPVSAVKLPPRLNHCYGKVTGEPAKGDRVSIDTPMAYAQRPYNEADVIRYIDKSQGLDWNLFGHVTVIERISDGKRTMINGQHRTGLARTIDPSITEIPAHIIKTDDDEYAARLFGLMNGVASRNVSAEQLLWAEVLAKDPDALEIKRVLELCDVACGKVNDAPGRKQVKRANFVKCMAFGEEETILAVKLIKQAYPKSDNFDNLLSGLVRLMTLADYKELSDPNYKLGERFQNWFVNILPLVLSYKEATFPKYRQGPWYNGIAYGIMKTFRTYLSREDWAAPPLGPIQKIWEKSFKDAEDSDE